MAEKIPPGFGKYMPNYLITILLHNQTLLRNAPPFKASTTNSMMTVVEFHSIVGKATVSTGWGNKTYQMGSSKNS